MLKLNDKIVELGHFPDGTFLIKKDVSGYKNGIIEWKYESDSELVALIYLTKHLQAHGVKDIKLVMPYIPNARQDRVKSAEDVFTLKYFAEVINSLGFDKVTVLDPHSSVSEALIDRIKVVTPEGCIGTVLEQIGAKQSNIMMFFPDEGAMKRYASHWNVPYAFGIKKRDWATGKILGLDVAGAVEQIAGCDVLIVDDICSRGGTFYHSAKKLKELGAGDIYLYVTHCENTILDGEVLTSGLIKRVYTTDSIFTKEHEMVEVFKL